MSSKSVARAETNKPALVRYADDFIILHKDGGRILDCLQAATLWLRDRGLELNQENKSRIVHTLETGFDYLGFNVRQFPVSANHSSKGTSGKLTGFKLIIKPSKTSASATYPHDCLYNGRDV